MDPPEHTRLRKLVASAFTVRRVEALRPRVAAIVDELIGAFTARPQSTDLMTSFSLPLPVRVICELLGVPTADMDKFLTWSGTLVSDWEQDSSEILTALAELYGYFADLMRIKRTRPGDDLLSALIAARDCGDRLSEEELTNLACTILVAGYETTAHHISLSLLALLDHPAQMARLRADPRLIPGAVEELVRYVRIGVLPLARVTTEDVELGGVMIPAGEVVLPMTMAANPDRFDVSRAPASHLGFGSGAHHCLGAQLARVELQEALRGLVTRLPGLALAVPPAALRFKPGMAIHNLRALPITWTKT
jgi:cytochrome P450